MYWAGGGGRGGNMPVYLESKNVICTPNLELILDSNPEVLKGGAFFTSFFFLLFSHLYCLIILFAKVVSVTCSYKCYHL